MTNLEKFCKRVHPTESEYCLLKECERICNSSFPTNPLKTNVLRVKYRCNGRSTPLFVSSSLTICIVRDMLNSRLKKVLGSLDDSPYYYYSAVRY